MSAANILRRCTETYLRQGSRIWRHLPNAIRSNPVGLVYGRHLHALVERYAARQQYFGTFFLRNRAELELMCRLAGRKLHGAELKLTVLACSKGAEVYSMVWALRSAWPDLRLRVHAVDISPEIVAFAEEGIYVRINSRPAKADNDGPDGLDATAWNTGRDQNASIFERMAAHEMEAMFEAEGDYVKVRPWLRQGIEWHCADATDSSLGRLLGPQDMVVANRFLCHMEPWVAERSLRSIAHLVRPGGYLFVSGIDLDIREKIAESMGWGPVTTLLREVHEGDTSLRRGWPLEYWGLEPFRQDRPLRYASVFQVCGRPELVSAMKPRNEERFRAKVRH
jgi:chemotaxis methyl-accepting protein methylase